MPKRPRQHQLEEQSRIAFRAKLPSSWVFRDSVPDYGIDGTVEIFDDHALSTGRLFLVQLKATDELDLDYALKISLRLETCKYYDSLDLPVLIARFQAPTGRLYVKWFHTFDPYHGRRGRKSITFHLSPDDEWSDETALKLIPNLDTIKKIKSPQISPPVVFRLVIREAEVHGVPAPQIASAIRKATDRARDLITITPVPSENPDGSIVVENDKFAIDLAGAHGFTLHTAKGYPVEFALSKFPCDILVGAALALDSLGHSNLAARLVAEYVTNSSLIKQPEIVMRAARCMARANRVTEALQLSESLSENDELSFAGDMLMLAAYVLSGALSPSEQEYFRAFLLRRIERAEEKGDRRRLATAHYNFGNHLRASRQSRLAIHHYRKASEYDTSYLQRKYFWKELAGVLFEARQYRIAAKFYKRALDLGEEGLCRALYADALMFYGKYRESQKEFEAYLAMEKEPMSEWQLKARILPRICSMIGSDDQLRQTRRAREIAGHASEAPNDNDKRKLLEEALRLDALCALAWFNLGVLWSRAGEQDNAFFAFLLAAVTQRNDPEAWCNAIVLGIFSKTQHFLVPLIIEEAYFFTGEDIMEQLVRIARDQPKNFPMADFLSMMNDILAAIPKRREPVEFRLLKGGPEYDVIPVKRGE